MKVVEFNNSHIRHVPISHTVMPHSSFKENDMLHVLNLSYAG
jgi:hypothetical protein